MKQFATVLHIEIRVGYYLQITIYLFNGTEQVFDKFVVLIISFVKNIMYSINNEPIIQNELVQFSGNCILYSRNRWKEMMNVKSLIFGQLSLWVNIN